MSGWTGLDFFIFLIFLVNTLLGMARGGLKEIISLISLCAALVIAIKFTMPLTEFLNTSPLMTDVITSQFIQNFMRAIEMPALTKDMLVHISYSISLLICFVGTFSVCEAVLAYSSMIEAFSFPVTLANRKLGSVLGAIRGFVIVLIFINILEHLFPGNVPQSNFVNGLQSSVTKLNEIITDKAPQRYLEILQDKDLSNQPNLILNNLLKPT